MGYFKVRIFIKANSKESEFVGYNKDKDAFELRVKAPPLDNKANKEILSFLKKLKVNAEILQGFKSNIKVLSIEENTYSLKLFKA
jgi:hypothetical protein